MKIYTSYYANMKNIPSNITCIGISLYTPPYFFGPVYKKLSPTYNILKGYHDFEDKEKYIRRYKNDILGQLDPLGVIEELSEMSNCNDICLLCYEKTETFCHRQLVAEWLNSYGFECEEYIRRDI